MGWFSEEPVEFSAVSVAESDKCGKRETPEAFPDAKGEQNSRARLTRAANRFDETGSRDRKRTRATTLALRGSQTVQKANG